MDNHQKQRYYIRRRAELQKVEIGNTLKEKTVSILDKDARESIIVSLSDGRPKEEKKIKSKSEFLEKYGVDKNATL